MNVFQYFKLLFKVLEEKMFQNIPNDEKVDLDVKKWVWQGDTVPDEALVPKMKDPYQNKDMGVQTPDDLSVAKRKQNQHLVHVASRPNSRKKKEKDVKKQMKNTQMQTDDKIFRKWVD